MSNPAVIELSKIELEIGEFRVEDNLGEAIHVHFADFRIDLTINELHCLAESCKLLLENFLQIDGFQICDMDSSFLLYLSSFLPELERVEEDKVKVSELLVDTYVFGSIPGYRKINKSRVVKALRGNSKEDDAHEQDNYFMQSNADRRNDVFNSISQNGFDESMGKIVLYNNKNNIIDGQHRAAALYVIDPYMEVKVFRYFFAKGNGMVTEHPIMEYFLRWNRKRVWNLLRKIYGKVKKIKYDFFKNMFYFFHKKECSGYRDV